MRPLSTDLLDAEKAPSSSPVGSPEMASSGSNAGAYSKRGSAGVALTWIERQRLKRTIPIYDSEIDNVPLVIGRLKRALKGEDERGRRQHWTYSVPRHMALMKFLRLYEGIRDDRQDDDVSHGLGSSARRAAE